MPHAGAELLIPSPSTSQPIPDRRPIRSRNLRVWIALAHALGSAGVSANAISVFGMIAGLSAGAAFAATAHWSWPGPLGTRVLWILGALFVQLRLLCNMLDGMVAVESGKASPVGELYNEVPDRISDMAVLIGLGYAAASSPVLGYQAAALAVFVAYVRAAARVAGAPQDYRGPMAKQQRMFLCTLAGLFMGLTPESWHAPFWGGWTVPSATLSVIVVGCVLTAFQRLIRASGILGSRQP